MGTDAANGPKSGSDWDISTPGTQPHVFQSRYLHSAIYNPSQRAARVTFFNGAVVDYQFGPDIWHQLTHAESPGSFFNKHIRANYPKAKKVHEGSTK